MKVILTTKLKVEAVGVTLLGQILVITLSLAYNFFSLSAIRELFLNSFRICVHIQVFYTFNEGSLITLQL